MGERVTGATAGFRIVAEGVDVESEPPIEIPPARFAAGAGATAAEATGAKTGDLRATVTGITGGAAASLLLASASARAGGVAVVRFSPRALAVTCAS